MLRLNCCWSLTDLSARGPDLVAHSLGLVYSAFRKVFSVV